MAWDGVVVRFGEIGIKSTPVRRRMLDRLQQNILTAMERRGVEGQVVRQGPRLWLQGPDAQALLAVATHTFGVVHASLGRVCAPEMEAMKRVATQLALEREWDSFAVRASRDGNHPFTSKDLGIEVGSAIWKAAEGAGRKPSVDLDNPDLEIIMDVRQDGAYMFTERVAGPGGLPRGTQGKVVALLSDTASFVAAWLMMRRGCSVVPVHAGDTGSLPIEAVEALQAWGLPEEIELLPVCSGSTSKAALLGAADQIAKHRKCTALVTGDGLDSDLSSPDIPIPVLRPLCGLGTDETARWQTFAGIPDVEGASILSVDAKETVDSLLSMRRQVTL